MNLLAIKKSGDAGFTMIEVMIALLFIMFVMLGLGSFSTWSLSQDALARERTFATHIASELIEEWAATDDLNNYGFTAAPAVGASITMTATITGLGIPLTLIAEASAMTAPATVTGDPAQTLAGITERKIRVSWNHKGAQKEVFFTHATPL